MSQDMNEHTSANTVTASTSENLPTTEVNEQTTTNNGSMSIIAHLTELRKAYTITINNCFRICI